MKVKNRAKPIGMPFDLDLSGSFKIGDASPRQLSKIIHRLVENLRAVSIVPAALQEQDVQADLDKRKSDAD